MKAEVKFKWSVVFLSLLTLFLLFAVGRSHAQAPGAVDTQRCILCHETAHVGGAGATQTCIVCHKTPHVQGVVGTQTCIRCHETWVDNGIPLLDVLSGEPHMDYLPLNIPASRFGGPFYTIPEGYVSSSHNTPPFDPTATGFVGCERCHGSGVGHGGIGPIPKPVPNTATCGTCHKLPSFDFKGFLLTSHANKDRQPGPKFDLVESPSGKAKVLVSRKPKVTATLFKSDQTTPVKRRERIEECSVCHNYALQYDQFKDKIGRTGSPTPQVRCGACHDAHIPGPNGNQLLTVDTTVNVTLAGTTVTAVTPVTDPRNISYRNLKPYRINDTGAQDFGPNGIWTRGSLVSRPNIVIVSGVGALSESNPGSGSDRLFYTGGGFLENVHHGDTIFISGQASVTATLPGDAVNAGAPVTVQAALGREPGLPEERKPAGFEVESVLDDFTLAIKPAVMANATVTYTRATPPGGTGSLSVPVPFSGSVNFEVRDMKTNSENLCGSCHTQGKYKFTAWGKRSDNSDPNSRVDLSPTHNQNIMAQYRTSGHANAASPPFAEFSAFEYGSTHQPVYPFDMSITGSATRRNKGNTSFALINNPPASAGLGRVGNNSQFVLINNYACNQCHHGLGSIDYQKDRQGTEEAQVLWGDSTVTCVTCHDPHKDQNRTGKNVRIPVKLSYNSRFVDAAKNPRGGINKFMDGTDLPTSLGNGQLCLFCHQGRESGLTVYQAIIAARPAPADPNFPYTNPNDIIRASGVSFVNPHYLDSGSLLWSRNAWEYFFAGVPQSYSTGISSHQQLNCMGCHMSQEQTEAYKKNEEGGHTWKPQVETCQRCHGPIANFTEIPAAADYDGNGTPGTVFEEFGTVTPRVAPDVGSDGTGLFGQLVAALEAQGIFYNPDSYPYFFTATGGTFNAWTTNTLSAAFNLSWAYKSGTCVYYHNSKYVAQILDDSLQALGALPPAAAANRPLGTRNANDYRTIVVNP